MKFFFNKNENGHEIAEEIVMVNETLDVVSTEPYETEIAAAISLALHLYLKQLQEYERAVLTFQKIMKPYSPWSSKVYTLRQTPLYLPQLRNKR